MTAARPGDELREEVRDVLSGWPLGGGYYQYTVGSDDAAEMVDALLPVVTAWADRRVAAVLRAAAQEQRNEAKNVPDTDESTHADGHRCAADFLDRRAARADDRAGK